jgi:hypothetical protein
VSGPGTPSSEAVSVPVAAPVAAPAALDADTVVAHLQAVPVVRLHEGSAVGTHLPGRRVSGVRLRERTLEVHAAVVYPATVEQAATAVREALATLPLERIDVTIDDVVLPPDPAADEPDREVTP